MSATSPLRQEIHFNCPMVTSYAENIKNNVEELTEHKVKLQQSFYGFLPMRKS